MILWLRKSLPRFSVAQYLCGWSYVRLPLSREISWVLLISTVCVPRTTPEGASPGEPPLPPVYADTQRLPLGFAHRLLAWLRPRSHSQHYTGTVPSWISRSPSAASHYGLRCSSLFSLTQWIALVSRRVFSIQHSMDRHVYQPPGPPLSAATAACQPLDAILVNSSSPQVRTLCVCKHPQCDHFVRIRPDGGYLRPLVPVIRCYWNHRDTHAGYQVFVTWYIAPLHILHSMEHFDAAFCCLEVFCSIQLNASCQWLSFFFTACIWSLPVFACSFKF